jgi:hypothetical protein
MHGIGVSHEQDIPILSLVESVNNKVLAKARYVDTSHVANAVEFICGLGQEINNSTAARFIA